MEFDLDKGLAVLNRTPGTLKSMLSGLPSPWTSATEGPDTWSPQDVVGHLIHGEETDWIPRAKIILTKGESQAFEPFDRFAPGLRESVEWLERLRFPLGEDDLRPRDPVGLFARNHAAHPVVPPPPLPA